MQTYCGLVDCTGSTSETVFSLYRLLKSCVRYKFSIFIAFLSSPLLFLSRLPPCNKSRPILHRPPASPKLCWRMRSRLWLLGSSHAEKKQGNRSTIRPVTRGGEAPLRRFFAPPGKMCLTYFETVGHSFKKNLGPSENSSFTLVSQAG